MLQVENELLASLHRSYKYFLTLIMFTFISVSSLKRQNSLLKYKTIWIYLRIIIIYPLDSLMNWRSDIIWRQQQLSFEFHWAWHNKHLCNLYVVNNWIRKLFLVMFDQLPNIWEYEINYTSSIRWTKKYSTYNGINKILVYPNSFNEYSALVPYFFIHLFPKICKRLSLSGIPPSSLSYIRSFNLCFTEHVTIIWITSYHSTAFLS